MEKEHPYKNWTINQRIEKILQDEDFRKHCLKCKQSNPNFDEELAIAEKIALIDTSYINFDYSLIYPDQKFTAQDIRNYLIMFYEHLDSLSDNNTRLTNTVKNNFQYVKTDNGRNGKARSYCSVREDSQRNIKREIFINPEGRIGDITTGIHELGHSLSNAFTQHKLRKDNNMVEVFPVILDAISNHYLSQTIPNLESNFNAHAIETQIINVVKAREALLDGLVIKLMLGETTLDEIASKYGHIYLTNTNVLLRCLENIENIEFTNMYEIRYLVPQAIALKLLDIYKDNPKQAVSLAKEILQNDTNWTLKETLNYLGIESTQTLIDEYVANYHTRMANLLSKQSEME